MKATMIDARDNVAVVLGATQPGEQVQCSSGSALCTVQARECIPIYHKICVRDIRQGEPVVKYGEHIGIAAQDIEVGAHVHAHNVRNNREVL